MPPRLALVLALVALGSVPAAALAADAPRARAGAVARPSGMPSEGDAAPSTDPPAADDPLPQLPYEPVVRAAARGGFEGPQGLGGGSGDLWVARASAVVEGGLPVASRVALVGSLAIERSWYDFSDADAVVAGDGRLFEEAVSVRASLGGVADLDERWRVLAAAGVDLSCARGAHAGDAVTWGGTVAARRVMDLPFGLKGVTAGATVKTVLEDRPTVFPYLSFDGGPGGRVRARIRSLAAGPMLGVSYGLSERVAVGAFAGYWSRDFRMAPDDRIPEGVFRELRAPLGLSLDWRPTPSLAVSLEGGCFVWTRLDFCDARGGLVRRVEADPAPFFSLSATLRF